MHCNHAVVLAVSNVVAWIAERDATAMHLTAVSEAELRCGVAILPAGRRRSAIETAMRQRLERGFTCFTDRNLPLNVRDFERTGVDVVDPWTTG